LACFSPPSKGITHHRGNSEAVQGTIFCPLYLEHMDTGLASREQHFWFINSSSSCLFTDVLLTALGYRACRRQSGSHPSAIQCLPGGSGVGACNWRLSSTWFRMIDLNLRLPHIVMSLYLINAHADNFSFNTKWSCCQL